MDTRNFVNCAFSYAAPQIWTVIPLNIRISPSISAFKSSLKKKTLFWRCFFNPVMCHQWLPTPPILPTDRHCTCYKFLYRIVLYCHDDSTYKHYLYSINTTSFKDRPLMRPVMKRKPSSSFLPMSPDFKHKSLSNTSSVLDFMFR